MHYVSIQNVFIHTHIALRRCSLESRETISTEVIPALRSVGQSVPVRPKFSGSVYNPNAFTLASDSLFQVCNSCALCVHSQLGGEYIHILTIFLGMGNIMESFSFKMIPMRIRQTCLGCWIGLI